MFNSNLGVAICLLLLTGCATGTGKIDTHLSNYIYLKPTNKHQKRIFIKFSNVGEQDIDLLNDICWRLKRKGYRLTKDPEVANIVLRANVIEAGQMHPQVLLAAYESRFGQRVYIKDESSGGAVGQTIRILSGQSMTQSFGIICDVRITEFYEEMGRRKQAAADKKTRITTGVTGIELPENIMGQLSFEVIKKITAIF